MPASNDDDIMARPRRLDPFRPVELLTSLWSATGVVRMSGRRPEWRIGLPPKPVDDIIAQLSVTGMVLDLSRRGRLL